jgi:hypothetical protein
MYLNTIFINNNPEQFGPFHFEEKVNDDERLECIPRNKILEKTVVINKRLLSRSIVYSMHLNNKVKLS